MVAEEFLSGINANIFLREFSFNKNKFIQNPQEEVEFADHVIWVDDLLIIFQLKERESNSGRATTDSEKWFKKKVLGKATKQIRDSLNYLFKHKNITVKNQRGDTFTLNPESVNTIIKIVAYLAPQNSSEILASTKYHKSSTAGFIHVLPISDYIGICNTLFTPTEIKEYFLFRESLFAQWPNETSVLEPALVGQFLYGEFVSRPSNNYLQYYKAFLNTIDEFNIANILQEMKEHIDFSVGNQKHTDYYQILIEFSKLTRMELSEVKTRLDLCLSAAYKNEFKKPYRLVSPTTGCGFVFIPITKDIFAERIIGLENLTFAAKYDSKLEKCIGVSVGYLDNQYFLDWAYVAFPWKYDQELKKLLKETYPFRPLRKIEKHPYFFDSDDLKNPLA